MFILRFLLAWTLAQVVRWTDTFSPFYIAPSVNAPALLAPNWTGCTVHLFVNNITFDFSTLIGGLTEATFAGYAPVTPASATPNAASGKNETITVSNCVFTRSMTGAPQTAYGWYALDGLGELIGGGTFGAPGPFVFATAGDALTLAITQTLTVVP